METLSWEEFIQCRSLSVGTASAVTMGVFDGVHRGHAALLGATAKYAQLQKNQQSIVFTFRFSPKKHTKSSMHRNLQTIEQRLYHISRFGISTVVLINFTPDFARMSGHDFLARLLERLHISYIALGDDFRMGHQGTCTSNSIMHHLQNVSPWTTAEIFPTVAYDNIRISSSLLRATVIQGNLAQYALIAGHPYELTKGKDNWNTDCTELLVPPAGKYIATALDANRNIIWANHEIELDAKGVPNGGSINSVFTLQLHSKHNQTD